MKYLLLLFLSLPCVIALAQHPVGIFSDHTDIGNPKKAGSTQYDGKETYTLQGSGYNIWFGRDEFQYAYKNLTGDFTVTANFEFVGTGAVAHRKIGWMVRQSMDEASPHYSAVLHGDGLTMLQWRPMKGANMRDPEDQITAPKKKYQVLQLERKGNTITMRAAPSGEPLQTVGATDASVLGDNVLVGLFICAHNPEVIEQASVWNVRIDKPKSK